MQVQVQEMSMKKEVAPEATKSVKATPSDIFKSVYANFKEKYKINSAFEFEARLKKDKKLKQDFENELANKLKEAGLRADPKSVLKTGLREAKVEEYRKGIAAKMVGIEKANEDTIKKLQGLFDSVAKQCGEENPIKFYHKYVTDPKFRDKANTILMKEIKLDPELSNLLGKGKPEEIMHDLARIRATFMSKKDYAKFAVTETIKHIPIEFAKYGATVAGGTIASMMMAPMYIVLNTVPGMNGASQMIMNTISQISNVFTKISEAMGNIKTSTPQSTLLGQYIPDKLKDAGEEVSKNLSTAA